MAVPRYIAHAPIPSPENLTPLPNWITRYSVGTNQTSDAPTSAAAQRDRWLLRSPARDATATTSIAP